MANAAETEDSTEESTDSPLIDSPNQAIKKMVAKAKEKNLCFGIDLNHRFTPAARLARKWLDEGRLGHLTCQGQAKARAKARPETFKILFLFFVFL